MESPFKFLFLVLGTVFSNAVIILVITAILVVSINFLFTGPKGSKVDEHATTVNTVNTKCFTPAYEYITKKLWAKSTK